MASQNSKRAIDLLGENGTGKLMRQRNAAKGEQKIGTLPCRGGPAVRRANRDDQALGAVIAQAAQMCGKLLRGVLLAAAIEQNRLGRGTAGLTVQPIEEGRLRLKDLGLARNITRGAVDIVGKQTVAGLGLGSSAPWSDRAKCDLHRAQTTLHSSIRKPPMNWHDGHSVVETQLPPSEISNNQRISTPLIHIFFIFLHK
jgi:hypothetical protein